MVRDLDTARRLEDAGAAALVMDSLFEEQLMAEQVATAGAIEGTSGSFAEALSYFPSPPGFRVGPEEYLEQIGRLKEALAIPVFGSLNGTTAGGWLEYAKLMADAGADGLELNVYELASDPGVDAGEIEERTLAMIRQVRRAVKAPIALKLSPFYTSLPHFARRAAGAGADGLVLFNRFYQPDIDVEELEVIRLSLSDSSELLLRLHWTAILSGRVDASLAVTGGVHDALDVIKAVMTGAHAVQMVSAIYQNGPEHLRALRGEIAEWLEEHEYDSLRQMQGSMSLLKTPDPDAYERANYIKVLRSFRG